MKGVLSSMALAALMLALSPADAWANPQHERMRNCNKEAKEQALKGDERKQFMSTCLKGSNAARSKPATVEASAKAAEPAGGGTAAAAKGTAKPPSGAQDSIAGNLSKECNRAATEKGLKGAERKSFVSECLKG